MDQIEKLTALSFLESKGLIPKQMPVEEAMDLAIDYAETRAILGLVDLLPILGDVVNNREVIQPRNRGYVELPMSVVPTEKKLQVGLARSARFDHDWDRMDQVLALFSRPENAHGYYKRFEIKGCVVPENVGEGIMVRDTSLSKLDRRVAHSAVFSRDGADKVAVLEMLMSGTEHNGLAVAFLGWNAKIFQIMESSSFVHK